MARPDVPRGTFALTIWQPWATLIMLGAKPNEFRKYMAPRPFWNERIVIHAGKRMLREPELVDLINRLEDPEQAWTTGLEPSLALPVLLEALTEPRKLPLGAGVGTAILGQPVLASQVAPGHVDSDRLDHCKWAWPLTGIQPFAAPVECGGAQGFWRWPEASEMAARAA